MLFIRIIPHRQPSPISIKFNGHVIVNFTILMTFLTAHPLCNSSFACGISILERIKHYHSKRFTRCNNFNVRLTVSNQVNTPDSLHKRYNDPKYDFLLKIARLPSVISAYASGNKGVKREHHLGLRLDDYDPFC